MPITRQLRARGITKETLLSAVSDEILPVLADCRAALNRWLVTPPELVIGSGAVAVDWTARRTYTLELDENITSVTFTDPADAGWYQLIITQGATYTVSGWPSSVLWVGGSAPTVTATAGRKDLIELFYDGENYIGAVKQNAF